MSDLAIGIVGCGKIARDQHLPAIAAVEGLTAVAIADPYVTHPTLPSYDDLTAMLAAHPEIGAVALCQPPQARFAAARKAIQAFTGMDIEPSSPDFADAIGELVNMISGAAKAKFEGKNVSISCPSVVIGKGHKVQQPSDALCITIPFECPVGEFSLEVAMKVAKSAANTTSNSAARAA